VPRAIFQCSGETGHLPGEALLSASTRNSRRLTILQQIHEPALLSKVYSHQTKGLVQFFFRAIISRSETHPLGAPASRRRLLNHTHSVKRRRFLRQDKRNAGATEVLSGSSMTELTH